MDDTTLLRWTSALGLVLIGGVIVALVMRGNWLNAAFATGVLFLIAANFVLRTSPSTNPKQRRLVISGAIAILALWATFG